MMTWFDPEAFAVPESGTVVTIGVFDGVHVGHRAVIAHVRDLAAGRRAESVVVTFDRHPASIVKPGRAPLVLTDLAQKLDLLASTGVDHVVVVRFDEARSLEPAEDFVARTLVGQLGARTVVVGEDFRFGHRRAGDVALLAEVGAPLGMTVSGLALVSNDSGLTLSSTRIRHSLGAGDLATANRLLGRPHEVRGVVQAGDRRGRELGFPTANVAVAGDVCLPADGIYAGWYVRPDGSRHMAAVSLGRRPTFYEDQAAPLLEPHLLDFSGDLYHETARVQFVKRLRGEQRFSSVDALIEQIHIDCAHTREALSRA